MAVAAFREEAVCPHCGSTAYLGGVDGQYHCGDCGLAFQQSSTIEVDHDNGCWTERMIGRLRQELKSDTAAGALDMIARRAPNTVTYDEVVAGLKVEPLQLRAELAVLSKTCRRLFGRKIWPMSARQGWGGGEKMGYRMRHQVAQWWLDSANTLEDSA